MTSSWYMYVSMNWVIILSRHRMSPFWRRALSWSNVDVLSVSANKLQYIVVETISFLWNASLNDKVVMIHYGDVLMGTVASQITSLTIVNSTVYSGADQIKHQSSVSLAFVRGIHRGLVNSPHKWPVTRKMFPFDDVIMRCVRVCYWRSIVIIFQLHTKSFVGWCVRGVFAHPYVRLSDTVLRMSKHYSFYWGSCTQKTLEWDVTAYTSIDSWGPFY